MAEGLPFLMMCILLTGVALFGTLLATVLVVVPAAISPISWLPEASEAKALLRTLLTAQAAIAALTLAVTLFVLQGASARNDTDDRMYREYVRRSWVRKIFSGSLIAVGLTGMILLAQSITGAGEQMPKSIPDLRNLTLLAALAFVVNLVLAMLLFERARRTAGPENWRAIRRYVNERDVHSAVQVFLGRARLAAVARNSENSNFTFAFPDSGEGSANEVVRVLLDDGRRAMADRRQKEFAESLKSIKGLVGYAMTELEGAGIRWGSPGSRPEWPPLRELGNNLHSFREEVFRRGDRDQLNELAGFDYWFMDTGIKRGCGELFTVGLAGYRRNYEIANLLGNKEWLQTFGEQFWQDAPLMVLKPSPKEAFPYIRQMMSHQISLLKDAMRADYGSRYKTLYKGFEAFLWTVGRYWKVNHGGRSDTEELFAQLEQDYRIALMGLGGRAVKLAESGTIASPSPYVEVVRGKHPRVEILGDDIAQTFASERIWEFSQWFEWDMEGADNFEVRSVFPQKYPLIWFALRLMELATSPIHTLDLRGNARQILGWFTANPIALADHVSNLPAPTEEERRELAIDALRGAVRKDEVAEEHAVIRYQLSAEKVAALEADVSAAAYGPNSIERLFERAGAVADLPNDAQGEPDERRIYVLEHKGLLADLPEEARTYYPRLEGTEWGRDLSADLIDRFCKVLDELPPESTPLNTPKSLLRAIDKAISALKPSGEVGVVLAGNWRDIESELKGTEPDGYEPDWRIPEADRLGEVGRFRGAPIFRGPANDKRQVYVVEPQSWGRLVRAKIKGSTHPNVEVSTISAQRANELLDLNPLYFPEEPNEATKIRKLQTRVEILVSHRKEFQATNPSRARRIVDLPENRCR